MNAISIPGAGSEAFIEPSANDMAEFREAISLLLRREYDAAAFLADGQGYDLIEFSDIFSDLQPYYVLLERTGMGFRGLGTYVFNPAARRRISIQAPHVPSDLNTGPESVEVFLDLNAEFWQINGTHRCANSALTDCDGRTSACEDDEVERPHRKSDAAHFTHGFFQIANDEVAETLPQIFSIQLHSFSVCKDNDPDDTPLAQLSNVSSARTPNSIATRLAREINERAFAAGYPARGAVSWNAIDTDPADVQVPANVCPEFNGGANVQGRSLHGSSNPCEDPVRIVPVPERFVHIEQRSVLTRGGPGFPDNPGISREIVTEAIAAEFPAPSQRWLRFAHNGPELGTYAFPHSTLTDAVDGASPGETIRIRAGSSDETGTFRRRVTLRGFDGRVMIGN